MAVERAPLLRPWQTPFVGRVSELATLIRHLDVAEAGQGSMVLLGGDVGIGTYRDVELTLGHPLSRVLGCMLRRSHVQRLVLGGLSPAEVVQLVAETPGVPHLAETVLRRAEGNLLFVGEML